MQTTNAKVMVNEGGRDGGAEFKRGTKRDASDSKLSDFERFEKRLRMLTLRNENRRAIEVKNPRYNTVSDTPGLASPNGFPHGSICGRTEQDEVMHVDDTPDRVYIHDLDAELADVESDEEKLIFLPDIEKKLSRIPEQFLKGRDDSEHENQELVLYTEPRSLTVDESHDSVRKAILEARHRAREKAAETARQEDMDRKYGHPDHVELAEIAHGYATGYNHEPEPDIDAMDIG